MPEQEEKINGLFDWQSVRIFISESDWREFKKMVVDLDTSMSDWLAAAIAAGVKKHKAKQ